MTWLVALWREQPGRCRVTGQQSERLAGLGTRCDSGTAPSSSPFFRQASLSDRCILLSCFPSYARKCLICLGIGRWRRTYHQSRVCGG
nr:MAG: hypothetical protein DIU59_06010 [Pseudomonadota bacterium]